VDEIAICPPSDADYEFCYQAKKISEGDLVRRHFGWEHGFALVARTETHSFMERGPSRVVRRPE
jgi:hypothetical protein